MDFCLSPKHAARQIEFREFADRELQPAGHTFPRDNLRKMAGRGYMGLPVPREWGGQGEDFFTYILLIEEISRICASTGVILAVHTSVGTFPLLYYGTQAQKERYLPGLARGELLGAFALSEAGAGSDAAALRTSARRIEEGYCINGGKVFITSGGEADLYTVFATLDQSLGSRGICAFLIEKGTPGLTVAPPEKKMGLHGSATTELQFTDLVVGADQLLGEEGKGFALAMSLLDGGRIGIAAQGLGLARASLEATAAYLASRLEKGDQVSQWARFTLADLFSRLEAARLLTYRAALLKEKGQPCSREAAMAKCFATDLAVEAAIRCIDLWPPDEYEGEYPLFRYFCDAKVTQIYEGTNQIQRLVISRDVLKTFHK
ncbi:MAG TPA: acyl-CoA dehydrogenase family protein [Bacillota bacterium]|nr:acyl-CoA dehydrogenase family protein [Bacillota bacterium]